jgi:IS30 family transposase
MPYYDQTHLTAPQRDKTIVELRKRGYSYRAIGRQVGMDASGVLRALRRLEAGGAGTRDPRP